MRSILLILDVSPSAGRRCAVTQEFYQPVAAGLGDVPFDFQMETVRLGKFVPGNNLVKDTVRR